MLVEDNLGMVLSENTFLVDIPKFKNKNELFQDLAETCFSLNIINNKGAFLDALYDRESQGSTFMGNLIAIPHAKSECILKTNVVFYRTTEPFCYESNQESGLVKYIFLLAVSSLETNEKYLRILANLASLLANKNFLDHLATVKTRKEFLEIAKKYEV